MSKVYSNIFSIKGFTNLSSLSSLFERKYRELLPHSKKDKELVERMSEDEKYFIYSWIEIKEIQEMKVPKIDLENDETESEDVIQFQHAKAKIEYTKRKKLDDNGNFLPKKDRLNETEVSVLFFEKENQVYLLILVSNPYSVERVKKLIGYDNLSSTNNNYYIETNMFNWLFHIYTNKKGLMNEEITLENIHGFVGNVTDDANVFTGSSHHTTELIVTKAFISNGGDLKSIALRARDKEIDLTCVVDSKSSAVITENKSLKLRILDNLDKRTFLLLYFYGFIIPKLKQLYAQEAEVFVQEDSPKFSKDIGIDVIKAIVEKNDITLEDLDFLIEDDSYSITKKLLKSNID